MDPARSRTPIVLVCDRQYAGGRDEPHPLEDELIAALIKAGCDLEALDDYGCSALGYAANALDNKKVELLLSGGAHPDSPGAEFAPLVLALMNGGSDSLGVVWCLLRAGADVDACSVGEDGLARCSVREWIAKQGASGSSGVESSALLAFDECKALNSEPASPTASLMPPIRL